jgi:hypothetical protein
VDIKQKDKALDYDDFDRLLAGTVNEAWERCLPYWRERGRIEDLPRNLHVGRYQVTLEKWLGRSFAMKFQPDWQFVAGKLTSPDPVVSACAHDAIKYMIQWWDADLPAPAHLWTISTPLPEWVQQEIADCPNRYGSFHGSTLGELFRFEYED